MPDVWISKAPKIDQIFNGNQEASNLADPLLVKNVSSAAINIACQKHAVTIPQTSIW